MSKFNKKRFDDKLKTLKENRIFNLEKKLLDQDLKGYDHYVFINERGKAQVITNGNWVTEYIRTTVLKHNYQIDKVSKMLIKDFSDQEIKDFEDGLLS
tara:strand:+ start:75 stop:368 length:294 start_codon:yes stop_codon:yes gene_type:complete